MNYLLALHLFVAFLALTCVVSQRAGRTACNVEQLVEILVSSREELTSQSLLSLCSGRYSESICLAAGRSLRAEPERHRDSGNASLLQWASKACNAVEKVASRQKSLLSRQHRVASFIESDPIAMENNSLHNVLHHKSIPLPHVAKFSWETSYNYSHNGSAMLDQAVMDWTLAHDSKTNESSPAVMKRVKAFEGFQAVMPRANVNTSSNASINKTHSNTSSEAHASSKPQASTNVTHNAAASRDGQRPANALHEVSAVSLALPASGSAAAADKELEAIVDEVMKPSLLSQNHRSFLAHQAPAVAASL